MQELNSDAAIPSPNIPLDAAPLPAAEAGLAEVGMFNGVHITRTENESGRNIIHNAIDALMETIGNPLRTFVNARAAISCLLSPPSITEKEITNLKQAMIQHFSAFVEHTLGEKAMAVITACDQVLHRPSSRNMDILFAAKKNLINALRACAVEGILPANLQEVFHFLRYKPSPLLVTEIQLHANNHLFLEEAQNLLPDINNQREALLQCRNNLSAAIAKAQERIDLIEMRVAAPSINIREELEALNQALLPMMTFCFLVENHNNTVEAIQRFLADPTQLRAVKNYIKTYYQPPLEEALSIINTSLESGEELATSRAEAHQAALKQIDNQLLAVTNLLMLDPEVINEYTRELLQVPGAYFIAPQRRRQQGVFLDSASSAGGVESNELTPVLSSSDVTPAALDLEEAVQADLVATLEQIDPGVVSADIPAVIAEPI